jgi:hypothetical protein
MELLAYTYRRSKVISELQESISDLKSFDLLSATILLQIARL